MAGYGVYWTVLEMIATQLSKENQQTSIEFSFKSWRKFTDFSPKKWQKYVVFVAKLGLFRAEINGDKVLIDCPKMLLYRDEYQRKIKPASNKTPDNVRTNSQSIQDRIKKIENRSKNIEKEKDLNTSIPSRTKNVDIPIIPIPKPENPPVLVAKKSNGKTKPGKKKEVHTRITWEFYSRAYFEVYGTEPVRNQKTNSLIKRFYERLGDHDAPPVAEFYVHHKNRLYVSAGHCVDLLLRDAEKLRTEWATNTRITDGSARQADRTQTTANAFAGLLAEAEARENKDGTK